MRAWKALAFASSFSGSDRAASRVELRKLMSSETEVWGSSTDWDSEFRIS